MFYIFKLSMFFTFFMLFMLFPCPQAVIAKAVESTLLRQLASAGMEGPAGAVAAAQWASAPGFPTTPVPAALEGLRARLASGELDKAIVEVRGWVFMLSTRLWRWWVQSEF